MLKIKYFHKRTFLLNKYNIFNLDQCSRLSYAHQRENIAAMQCTNYLKIYGINKPERNASCS